MPESHVYEITNDLYPIPELVQYYTANGFKYDEIYNKRPELFPYDQQWRDWNRDVRQVAKARNLQMQPIIREVPVIYRYKLGDSEKMVWSERFKGINTKTGKVVTFKHLNGVYQRHLIETEYDEDTNAYIAKLRGVEKVYYNDFNRDTLTELFKYAPIGKPQNYFVVVMNRTRGGLGLFSQNEFRDSSIETLTKLALSAKGLVHTTYNIETDDKDEVGEALKVIINDPRALEALAQILAAKQQNNRDGSGVPKDENSSKVAKNTSTK